MVGKAKLFCDSSSIRGVNKIAKSRFRFLKILWTAFVFTMTVVLLVGATMLILNYLNYDTAWNTSTRIDDNSPFPAFTVCSQNPFSERTKRIWRDKNSSHVLTPNQFRDYLHNITLHALEENSTIGPFAKNLALYDKIETYYANLEVNETRHLGHTTSIFMYCILQIEGETFVGENCSFPNLSIEFTANHFSHRDYFNCFTLSAPRLEHAALLQSVILVVSLTPFSSVRTDADMDQLAFFMDILHRGEGLKVVVHELGTLPDIARFGINIEPGKMNEINYQTFEWVKYSTPKAPCYDAEVEMVDLNVSYKYTLEHCLQEQLQRRAIEKCRCMHSEWVRPVMPSRHTIPYCLSVMNKTLIQEHTACLSQILMKEYKPIKRRAEGSICPHRCREFSYETMLSVTKWVPDASTILKLTQVIRSANLYFTQNRDGNVTARYMEAIRLRNLSNDAMRQKFQDKDSYTYVALTRRSPDTTVKLERLVLDVSILLSRIGGLCSLCIGLTAAFVVEIVECLYLMTKQSGGGAASASGAAAGQKQGGLLSGEADAARTGMAQLVNGRHVAQFDDNRVEDESWRMIDESRENKNDQCWYASLQSHATEPTRLSQV